MKIFWNYEENSENILDILKTIIKDNKLQIISLPESIKDSIKASRYLTIEELEKIDKSNLKEVIFDFRAKSLYKISYPFIDKHLADIFFNKISEHRFSHYSYELSEEEYSNIIDLLQDTRIILNEAVKKCMEDLITAVVIYKNEMKIPSKKQISIKINFLKNITFINEVKNLLKFENFKYLDNIEKELINLCNNDNGNLNLFLSKFVNTDKLKEKLYVKSLILELIENYPNLTEEKRKEKIQYLSYTIWLFNDGKLITYLCNEKEDFTEENIYEKLKLLFEEYFTKEDFSYDKKNNNLNIFERELTYESMKSFLQNLDRELLLNYLKLFLFCCRPDEFIDEKDILNKIDAYKKLDEYIKKDKIISKDFKALLFDEKIKDLLLIFQEKIISFPTENLKENNIFIATIRKKFYSELSREYIENILSFLRNLSLANKEFYNTCVEKIKVFQKQYQKPEIKNGIKEAIEYDKKNNLNIFPKHLNIERLEEMSKAKIKKNIDFVLDEDYLKIIKEFTLSSPKRIGIYYEIFLLYLLSSIKEKEIENFVKNKGYEGENYLTYFKALKRNKKNLGKEHLKYIFNYFDEKDKEKREEFIACINNLTLYNKNPLLDILDFKEYEGKTFLYAMLNI